MPSQSDLETGIEVRLFGASLQEGEVKTYNDYPEQVQRPIITDRDYNGKYDVFVELLTCVHGDLDHATRPASLMIFEYRLNCLEEKHTFSSVKTGFEFTDPSGGNNSHMEVLAFAPFNTPQRWNSSGGNEEHGQKVGVQVGPKISSFGANILLEHDKRKHFEKRYSTYGTAGRRSGNTKVYWYMRQNSGLKDGVPPVFRVAILLGRSDDRPFQGTFEIELHGWFRLGLDRFLRRTVDDPINFDPTAAPKGLPTGVDPQSLGNLSREYCLVKLTPVWGLDPLVESAQAADEDLLRSVVRPGHTDGKETNQLMG